MFMLYKNDHIMFCKTGLMKMDSKCNTFTLLADVCISELCTLFDIKKQDRGLP